MKSIKVSISAAKCRVGVKYKQFCTSNHCTSYFKYGRRLSILSDIILAILLLASCTKDGSNLSFIIQRGIGCTEGVPVKHEIQPGLVYGTPCRQNIQVAYFGRLGFSLPDARHHQKAHSFPMEDFSNVHDSIRDEFMRIATAKRRTFKDVLLLKMKATPYKGMKETDSLSLVASRFFESLDSLPEYKGDKTRILTTYHFFLER